MEYASPTPETRGISPAVRAPGAWPGLLPSPHPVPLTTGVEIQKYGRVPMCVLCFRQPILTNVHVTLDGSCIIEGFCLKVFNNI